MNTINGSSVAGLVIALMLACVAGVAQEAPKNLYVAPNGNDAWSGTLPAPNAAGTDGPVATVTRAKQIVRAMKTAGTLAGPVHVQLRGGLYRVMKEGQPGSTALVPGPITFEPEDSGTAAAPIYYEAYPGERPILHGGRRITGWKQEGSFWTVDLPDVREGKWAFGALWVNGERRVPARTPNSAHLWGDEPEPKDVFITAGPVVEKDAAGKEVKSATKFRYQPGDLKPGEGLQDAIVVVYHSWETSLLRVKNLDEQNHIVEFTGPAAWNFAYWGGGQRYYVEQLFEALDQPGEWYLNRKTGKLYYLPLPGEDMAKAEAFAPEDAKLMVLAGSPAAGKFVEHLHFKGLCLYYTDYAIEPQGHSDGQAAASVGAAFEATGAVSCSLENCEIGHVATYGAWFHAGCKDNRLVHSEVFDTGAGGIRIGEAGDPPSENEAALRNEIDNCFIHDGGKIFRGAVGLWIGKSSYNRVAHNEICDFRYTGISVGWSWGYAPTSANHNVIEYNHIHHIGHGQLNDMGGIYTLGISPGTVVQYNLFHDVLSYPPLYGGWGIYFDEGSTDIVAENNIVYNTLTGGFHQHYGRENRVKNNIFAFSHGPQIVRSREEEHTSFFFERNIVYFNNGQLLGSAWHNGHYVLDNNVYWDTSGEELRFDNKTFDEWKAAGFDVHSMNADPLFVNAEAGDFQLKPDSPALKLGFKPIDLSKTGLYGEAEWVSKPKQRVRPPFTPPAQPAPNTFAQDFESVPAGEKPPDASAYEEGAATIRVTDETAAAGKHSLKFTDAAGLQHQYNPHLVYTPHLASGRATGAFAVRMEPGAILIHEWRDDHAPYRIGPNVTINAAGELSAGGKTLLTVPHGQWVRVQIECALGKAASGTFNLSVTLPGLVAQRFEALPCAHKEFHRLDWLGFISNANAATTFYLDDATLEVK